MHLVRLFWKAQSLMMKRIFGVLGFLAIFLLIHGTWTLRTNYQRAFAKAVETKIAIETIHVKALRGTLVLMGVASKEQKIYAEYVAKSFIERYASRTINAPSEVRSEIQINTGRPAVTKTRIAARDIASHTMKQKNRAFSRKKTSI